MPWTDYVLFRNAKKSRVIQNIGGIANLTWLRARGSEKDVIAFDCGPGNMVIDALVKHFSRGKKSFDTGGRLASRGRPDNKLFADMVARVDPFMMMPPPRSLGREEFGEPFVQSLLARHSRRVTRAEDWIATATHLTAQTLFLSYWLYLRNNRDILSIDEIILCGGGAKNVAMIELVRGYLRAADRGEHIAIRQMDEFGISTQAKECVSFAMLAAACVDRVPANLMQVTGAKRRVVLGQIIAINK
ncbi:MAG: anhydro-N-acetylmuramic acid kinase [Planctomycetes bacterium]|nr:anhydro-N-acetylmuramic acid kinase [Planctomycetota bacterium]